MLGEQAVEPRAIDVPAAADGIEQVVALVFGVVTPQRADARAPDGAGRAQDLRRAEFGEDALDNGREMLPDPRLLVARCLDQVDGTACAGQRDGGRCAGGPASGDQRDRRTRCDAHACAIVRAG